MLLQSIVSNVSTQASAGPNSDDEDEVHLFDFADNSAHIAL